MKNLFLTLIVLISFIVVTGCSKLKEKVEQKVSDKVEEEVKKSTEEVNKQLKQADSVMKTTGEQLDKELKKQEAIDEESIISDPLGQWASDADASSSYASDIKNKTASWSAPQMTGKPNVEKYGDNGYAWASKVQDKGLEWVELTFPKSVYASEIRVRQNYNPGAIIKIAFYDEKGNQDVVWDNTDKTEYVPNKIQWFIAKFDKTDYKTKKVRITLATNTVKGWNEIDAVQLIGN